MVVLSSPFLLQQAAQLLLAYPFCQGKRFAHGVVFDSIAIVVHYHFPVCLLVW
jgi:hypothetical protein